MQIILEKCNPSDPNEMKTTILRHFLNHLNHVNWLCPQNKNEKNLFFFLRP